MIFNLESLSLYSTGIKTGSRGDTSKMVISYSSDIFFVVVLPLLIIRETLIMMESNECMCLDVIRKSTVMEVNHGIDI